MNKFHKFAGIDFWTLHLERRLLRNKMNVAVNMRKKSKRDRKKSRRQIAKIKSNLKLLEELIPLLEKFL